MNSSQAWQATLGQLQMEMSKAAFDTWVKNAELVSCEGDTFVIGVQNAYARDWLENRLASTISRSLTGLMGQAQSVRFCVYHKEDDVVVENDTQAPVAESQAEPKTSSYNNTINSRYTFDTFVVGASRRSSSAAHGRAARAACAPAREACRSAVPSRGARAR